jgi:DNA-binding transcriptional LysR family regulator
MIKYYAFAKVVELKSISKAAAALGYSQPGLSHILNSFEKELGFPLLIKTKKTIEPTRNGLKVLAYCHQLIDIEQALLEEVNLINNNIMSGLTRIAAPNSMLIGFVTDLIGRFTSKYPDAEINVQENTLEDVAKNIHDCAVDIGFITSEFAGDYKFIPLFKDNICLAVCKDHPLAAFDDVSVNSLMQYEFIMQLKGWDDIAAIAVRQMNFKPKVKYFSASDVASLAMVANNLGIYILSELQLQLLPSNVIMIPFREEITRDIGIGIKTMKGMASSQKEFIEVTKQFVSETFPPEKLLF